MKSEILLASQVSVFEMLIRYGIRFKSRNKPMKTIVALFFLGLLAGCTTAPLNVRDASRHDSSKILRPELLIAAPGKVPVLFIRDSTFIGAACEYKMYINNEESHILSNGEALQLYLPPGRTTFVEVNNSFICSNNYLTITRELEVGDKAIVRTGLKKGWPIISFEHIN